MKKNILALLITSILFFVIVLPIGILSRSTVDEFKVAMVTDFSDVNDASFNQACYEGCKQWAKEHDITFNYYKPSDVSFADRVKAIKLAIDRGYKVIMCPGFGLADPIAEIAPKHPEVKFIGLDISPSDFPKGFDIMKYHNIAIYNYHEEIAGYMAGYGAVKEGFRKLGYLGGIAASAVIRFGYGYVQGINAAAVELSQAGELQEKVKVEYIYGGQFFGDSDIYKYIDNWYKSEGTEVVFSCGGSIYTSVALSAKENNRYMIGVDTDQSYIIDKDYGEGLCSTSAMKGIKQTVIDKLEQYRYHGAWQQGFNELGLVSKDHPEKNYVQLPLDTWRMKNFTIEDYKKLIGEFMSHEREVVREIDEHPYIDSSVVEVDYNGDGSIK